MTNDAETSPELCKAPLFYRQWEIVRDQSKFINVLIGEFGDFVPRSGNASGGGQPGWVLKCAPGGQNDFIYVIIQPPGWAPLMEVIGREDLITDPDWATPEVRLPKLDQCFALIKEWTQTKTKFEFMDVLSKLGIPCGPIMSMKELGENKALRDTETVVEVEHPERGAYLTVGNPIKLSKSPSDVSRAPLLGEHTNQVLTEIGFTEEDIENARSDGAI